MNFWRRIRGLLGTALIWGAVGALIGATMFTVRYQPWAVDQQYWPRMVRLLGMFVSAGGLWGSACGLAFGVAVWAGARRQRFDQLSARRFVLWGAAAGAAFPLMLYTPVVLSRGAFGAIPLYSTLTVISALLGAGFGRVVFSIAKRAPHAPAEPAALAGAPILGESEMSPTANERVR